MSDDWNIGLRRCPEKKYSLGGPTLKKKSGILLKTLSKIKDECIQVNLLDVKNWMN